MAAADRQPVQRISRDRYYIGQRRGVIQHCSLGHYSNECPKKLNAAPNANATAQQQRRVAARRKNAPSYPNNRTGGYFRLTAAEAPEAPPAELSMSPC
jgi:hypothetical protein